ncbi:MAG: phospholipid carrier-dependent glycosyltransferase [Chloroflexi bacterium]|nr:MAG: phospholipid carrier-dependent glycosyltransferase [Chloroflexota bacterium]
MATDATADVIQTEGADTLERPGLPPMVQRVLARVPERYLRWLPLAGVVSLAFGMNAWRLGQAGWGNTYYAAAVRSMTLSWSNFFFGAFDPGGFITVDKPPFFLWMGALSARLFGYSTWAILLPSAFAGAATVGILWLIVRRYFGTAAATIAALALALTPISVAVNRLNLPEPFYLLALVGAAGAILRSLEARRWWVWAALAGLLVGIAFNSKMLAGWIPGPAFVLAILVGWSGPWRAALRPTLGRLVVLGAVTLAASASWMLVVDRWPEDARPYIGGSTDNTVQDLVLGYNGISRVDGDGQGFGRNRGAQPPASPPAPGNGGQPPGVGPGPVGPPPGPGGARGPGGIIAGTPGTWRMFDAANGGQIGWLLPFALIGAGWSAYLWRDHAARRATLAIFVGWVLLHAAVFSYAEGIYHSYYTAALAPGIAALVGINAVTAIEVVRRHRAWLVLVVLALAVTVLVQIDVAGREPNFFGWLRPYVVAGAVAGGGALAVATFWRRVPHQAGMGLAVGALLLLPGAWSFAETNQPSLNASLPQAGPRQGAAGRTFGSQAFDDGTGQIAEWLRAHNDESPRWDLAVASAQTGSTLIARHSLSVMALGGFSGRDRTISVEEFAAIVARGDVRYVSTDTAGVPGPPPNAQPAPGPPQPVPGTPGFTPPRIGPNGALAPDGAPAGARPGGAPRGPRPQPSGAQPGALPQRVPPPNAAPLQDGPTAIMNAVRAACTPVRDPSLPQRYRTSLYDCAGRAEALGVAASSNRP